MISTHHDILAILASPTQKYACYTMTIDLDEKRVTCLIVGAYPRLSSTLFVSHGKLGFKINEGNTHLT